MSLKKQLKRILIRSGLAKVHPYFHNGEVRFDINGLHYDLVTPFANYAPWNGDKEFLSLHAKIEKNTLVDIYRCYELWQLAESIFNLNSGAAFLEIGVWRGGTSAILAKKLEILNGSNKLYLADTFEGVVKASEQDYFYNGGEHKDTSLKIVEDLFSNLIDYKHYQILKGIFPEDTAKEIPEGETFGLCHIDVDVYESGKDIINWIWNRLIVGGVLVFDDYGFHYTSGTTRLVDEQRNLKDRLVIHNLNGHAIVIKLA